MPVDRRFFDNLLSDKKMSLRQLATKMGMTHSQLSLTFSGARRMQLDEAAKLAKIFGVSITRIAVAAGTADAATTGRRCNVAGILQGDGRVAENPHIERTSVPDGLPDDVQAIQARTANSRLAWIDGWVMFFQPSDTADAEMVGRVCLVDAGENGRVVATVRRGYRDGHYALSGPFSHDDIEISSAAPILITRH